MQQDARTGFAQGNGRAGVDRVNRLEGLDRRALIQRALLLVGGAALSLPQVAWAQEGAPYLAPERLALIARSVESSVGRGRVSTSSSRWSPEYLKKQTNMKNGTVNE